MIRQQRVRAKPVKKPAVDRAMLKWEFEFILEVARQAKPTWPETGLPGCQWGHASEHASRSGAVTGIKEASKHFNLNKLAYVPVQAPIWQKSAPVQLGRA